MGSLEIIKIEILCLNGKIAILFDKKGHSKLHKIEISTLQD